MLDILPPPVAAPPRPPQARTAVLVAAALAVCGGYVMYLGSRIPNASIMNIAGMFVGIAGFGICAVGVSSAIGIWTRSPGTRFSVILTNSGLAVLTLLTLPVAGSSAEGVLAAGAVFLLSATLAALVATPPLRDWLREGEKEKAARNRRTAEERIEALANAPRYVQVLVIGGLALGTLFYIAGPPVPNGPVAAGLHERVDLLGLHGDLALGRPVAHEEKPRRFQLFRASERRRWVVEGDVPGVTQLVRDYLTSLYITEDEGGHIEAERCGIGISPKQKACHLKVTIDVREVGDGLVEVQLSAWASAHRY